MARISDKKKVLKTLEEVGCLFVYPNKEKRVAVPSIWDVLYPNLEMVWDWSDEAHSAVATVWRFREALSRSGDAVYTKWYKGRALFFSKQAFVALAQFLNSPRLIESLPREAAEIWELLNESSPQSSKELRENAGFRGKPFESLYQKSLKTLFERLLIVGYGEVDDGAFPSLSLGATPLMFEELWKDIQKKQNPKSPLKGILPPDILFHAHNLKKKLLVLEV